MATKIAPGLKGLEFVGNILDFYSNPLEMLAELARQHGNVARIELGAYCLHLLSHPDCARYVLQDNRHNYRCSDMFADLLPGVKSANGIPGDDLAQTRQQRLQTAFRRQYLEIFEPAITAAAVQLIQHWHSGIRGGALNIYPELVQLHQTILRQILLGNISSGVDSQLNSSLDLIRETVSRRLTAIIPSVQYFAHPDQQRLAAAVARVDTFVKGLISDRRAAPRSEADVVSCLLQTRAEATGEQFTDDEIYAEVVGLLLTTAEMSANTLAWLSYLLSQNCEAGRRLHAEVYERLAGQIPTLADASDLPYLHQCIQETWRLYPPAWNLLRETACADRIAGYDIPAGSLVMVATYLIQQQPDYWPDPQKFKPDRFGIDAALPETSYAYLPLGTARQQRLGHELAMMEIQLVLCLLIQAFEFGRVPGFVPHIEVNHSLRPRFGILVAPITRFN